MIKQWIALALTVFVLPLAHAQQEGIWDTRHQRWLTLQEFAQVTRAGEILVFGEEHATLDNSKDPATVRHHANHLRLMQALRAAVPARPVSVGMEFLAYPLQESVDLFRQGRLSESEFVDAVGWASTPIDIYGPKVLFNGGGRTHALNIPRAISSQVARLGPEGLTPEQRELLPPRWDWGSTTYFERFRDAIKDHAPPDAIDRYFWAQSLWDDTMAWKAIEARNAQPEGILVIIVGAFHVEFGDGLPAELRKALPEAVRTILQVEVPDWSPETLTEATAPDPTFGEHADYLWVSHNELTHSRRQTHLQ